MTITEIIILLMLVVLSALAIMVIAYLKKVDRYLTHLDERANDLFKNQVILSEGLDKLIDERDE